LDEVETAMINGVGSNSPVSKIVSQPISKQLPAEPPKQLRAADRLELSGASHLLAALKANTNVRADLVAGITQQIEAGTYETEAKLNATVERLLDEMSK
jgi:hypothetical protein